MEELSIQEISARMRKGELNSVQLTHMYLEQIAQLDQDGPRLNSVIELNPDALDLARTLDREFAEDRIRGPLHGIPILIKDNISTADKMTTTAGSLALEGFHAPEDAFLVRQLRRSGVVLLGKTNLSEWANFRSSHSSSGWSSRGGQTRNPYVLDRNPCGSSSGSAVAAAANLCAAAVGTETDGSIVCPSQTNGIVGIKPTLGLISRNGVIPIAHSQDTAGPMARTVADAAFLLGAMTGVDPDDPATQASQGKTLQDYSICLERGGLKGKRIGVARKYFGFDWRVDRIMDDSLLVLKEAGAEIIDPVELLDESKLAKTELEVLLFEFKEDLNACLKKFGPDVPVKSLEEIIRFNEEHRARVMPYFQQERMIAAQKKGGLSQKKYQSSLEKNLRLARQEGIDKTIQKYRLDAIVAPTGGPAWLTDLVSGDHYTGGGFSSLAAVAGYPHITVPAGTVFGLPVGISFFGSAWSEAELIRIAYDFEQASQVRQPPRFLPSVDLSMQGIMEQLKAANQNTLLL